MAQKVKADMQYIKIGNDYHIADAVVCRYIDDLEEQVRTYQENHQKYVDSINAEVTKQAERVALNLACDYGTDGNCLAHELDYYEEVDPVSCEPVFAFRKDVMTRILLALTGKTAKGLEYTR